MWDADTGKSLMVLTDHNLNVTAIAFSPDGQSLVSGCDDSTVGVWDVRSGELRQHLTGHTAYTVSVAFSPDSETIVSASYDNSICLWNPGHRRTLAST